MSEPDEFEDSELLRALRAPGSAEELADETKVLGAFRAANRRRGTLVRRIGLGGASAVLAVGLTGGVAAAYTGNLPATVQQFAHRTFFLLGVPDRVPPPATSHVAVGPSSTSPTPSRPTKSPSATTSPPPKTSPTSGPTGSPTKSSSPSTSPTTSPTTTPTPVAAVGIRASAKKVDEGQTIVVAGRVTDASGATLSGRRVALTMRTAGDAHPQVIAHKRTNADGLVRFTSPALAQDARFRLVAKGAHSTAVRVAVVPALAAQYSSRTLEISANSLWAGESVVVRTKADGVIAEVTLDANGQAQLSITLKAHRVRYFVRLRATGEHAAALTTVVAPNALNP